MPMQLQTQVTHPEAMPHVAGSLGLGRVVALLGALLALLQRLDRRIYVLHPQLSQRLPHRVHQRRAHPRRAGGLINTLQGPTQCVFADQLVHAQRLCAHRVPAQRGDVGKAPVPGKHPHHQLAQHIAFVWRVVASVRQRTGPDLALEHASGGQKLCKEHELASGTAAVDTSG